MKALLIRVAEDKYELYKELAREEGVSVAEFFRSAADQKVGARRTTKKEYSIRDLGTKIVFKGGPIDGSRNFDRYLYEFENKKMPARTRSKK